MRELLYAVEGKAANLKAFALDEPGKGGACHEYIVVGPDGCSDSKTLGRIEFQNGPINKDGRGVNGVQHEDLLAIIIDRLEGFQKGPYACDENEASLNFCKCALGVMHERTKKRIARGVEGTHKA